MKLEEVRELPVEKRPLITALVWLVLGLVAAAFAGAGIVWGSLRLVNLAVS